MSRRERRALMRWSIREAVVDAGICSYMTANSNFAHRYSFGCF